MTEIITVVGLLLGLNLALFGWMIWKIERRERDRVRRPMDRALRPVRGLYVSKTTHKTKETAP